MLTRTSTVGQLPGSTVPQIRLGEVQEGDANLRALTGWMPQWSDPPCSATPSRLGREQLQPVGVEPLQIGWAWMLGLARVLVQNAGCRVGHPFLLRRRRRFTLVNNVPAEPIAMQ